MRGFMFKFVFNLLMDTPGDVGAPDAGRGKPTSVEEDLKFLREGKDESKDDDSDEESDDDGEESDDNDSSEEGNEEETSDDDREESDENESEESEEEDSEESDDDTKEASGIVTVKDITKDFPEFFKKHPEVKGIIYRERQYSELFAEPKEAQQALVKAETFDTINHDVMSGNMEPLFEAIKNAKGDAFNKVVANILPTIQKLDESVYMKLVAVPLKRALRSALAHGLKTKNANLANSAQHLHQYIFEDDDISDKAEFEISPDKEKSEAEKKYEAKLAELDSRDHNNFKNTVDGEWLGQMKTSFMEKLDPEGVLSNWTKDKMFEDCLVEVNNQLTKDPRHMRNMEHLWKQAKASGYNSESKSRIVNAALARARQILPEVRSKLRSEALNERKRKMSKNGNGKKFIAQNKGQSQNRSANKGNKNPKSTSSMSELDAIRS